MNELSIISNVRCYENDGTVFLNLEDVARGLGFTRTANSGNQVIRWERVDGYLRELNVPTSGHDTFIPENLFYRLAMKAKNDVGEKFQAKVADEIIPSIRKHGAYMTKQTIEKALTDPDFLIRIATELKEEREKRIAKEEENKVLGTQVEEMKPKALFADAVAASHTSILVGDLAKLLRQNGVDIGQNRLFGWLRDNGYLIKSGSNYNMPTQKAMDMELFEVKESTGINPDGSTRINRTTKVTGKGQQYFINKFLKDKNYESHGKE